MKTYKMDVDMDKPCPQCGKPGAVNGGICLECAATAIDRGFTNEKLELIAAKAAEDLIGLVRESEAKILDAWHKAAEEAQTQESKPKFKLGFSITLDMDEDKMDCTLSFSVKHSLTAEHGIPGSDAAQPELPITNGKEQE